MSDDQRNPDNTDASSPSDQDQGPEEQQGEMEQATIEAGGQPPPAETEEAVDVPLPEASLVDDVEITTEEPIEAPADEPAEAAPTTPPPEVRMSPDAGSEALPLPGGPGSHPAPFDPRQAPTWQALLAEYE
jgi:hypothetical protein